MKRSRPFFILILVVLLSLFPSVVLAQTGTDEIRDYRIDVLPQDDGSLINTYIINWCVISDAAGPLNNIFVGIPNSDYQVLDFSGDARDVRSADSGATSQVIVILTKSINANECVTVKFRIHQMGLAHLDEQKGEIGFQFIPGWFSEVPVKHLQVTWQLPSVSTQIKSTTPEPNTRDNVQAVWETVLQPGGKLTLNLLYDKAAFPNFGIQSTQVWPLQGSTTTSEPNVAPTTTDNNGSVTTDNPGSSTEPLLSIFPIGLTTCICAIIIIILIIVFLVIIFSNGIRGYTGGGYIGGPRPGGGGIFGGSRPSGGGGIFGGGGGGTISLPPSRSGGGGGLFGGRGSSCACVSCACACACAGGGRAGCSRKGFDISGLLKKPDTGEE
jgi:hypothetical protein